jgi:hypothetical protein
MAKHSLRYLDPPPGHRDGERPPDDRAARAEVGRSRSASRWRAAGAVESIADWLKALARPGPRGLESPNLQTVQRGIAREFNRARRFQRPLSVVLLRADALKASGVEAAVRIALQRLRDTDIWFHDPDAGELVLVAPETGHEAAQTFGHRLADGLGAGRGVAVHWSTATFPADGLTFEVLYDACNERIAVPIHSGVVEPARLR